MSSGLAMVRRRPIRAAILALAAVATAACGTTVPMTQSVRAGGVTSDLTDGSTATTSQAGGSAAGASSATGASGTAGLGAALQGTTSANTSSPASGPVASGVTPAGVKAARGPLRLGALTVNKAGKYQASLGFTGATGDQDAMTTSVVSYINAHGGVGGRKIELITYDLDPTAVATDANTAYQAACTYFTQDNKVDALASYAALAPDSFYQCLAAAHLPVVSPDEAVSSDFLGRYASTFYMPAAPSYSRLLSDSVDVLWKAGWLTSTSTVGVVGYDTDDVHAIVTKSLLPALQRHGLKLSGELYTSTTTQAASEYNSGVLSFKSKGVDRVLFAPGGEPIYFALAAEQEAYHPYYEVGSLEYPTPLAANLPADQLVGSMGLGWLPYLDLPSSDWSGITTPGIGQCRKAVASANQDLSTGTTLGIAAWICDEWFFLRDAMASAANYGGDFRRGAESLGDAFAPASTFGSRMSPRLTHDGASAYRLVAFESACSCYKYVSPVEPMP